MATIDPTMPMLNFGCYSQSQSIVTSSQTFYQQNNVTNFGLNFPSILLILFISSSPPFALLYSLPYVNFIVSWIFSHFNEFQARQMFIRLTTHQGTKQKQAASMRVLLVRTNSIWFHRQISLSTVKMIISKHIFTTAAATTTDFIKKDCQQHHTTAQHHLLMKPASMSLTILHLFKLQ